MIARVDTYDARLTNAIRETYAAMVATGRIPSVWKRRDVLNSDEAARDVISRLPIEFRDIDNNRFRRVCDGLDKKSAADGGFVNLRTSGSRSYSDRVCDVLERWSGSREHIHSQAYDTDTPDRADWRRSVKIAGKYTCVCCGQIRTGELLQVHHYTYERLGHEKDGDACCVCSPSTGMPCHMLLDFAREFKAGEVSSDRVSMLFVNE